MIRLKYIACNAMKYVITVGLAIIFAVFATAAALPFVGDAPIFVPLIVGSLCGGLYLGRLVANALEYKPRPRTPRHSEARPNRSFADRLRSFVGYSQLHDDTLRASGTSRMPFWMVDISHERKAPKTSSYIRLILDRIHAILTQNGG